MRAKYDVVRDAYWEVHSPRHGYHLLMSEHRPKGHDVAFFTDTTGMMPITGRDIEDYSDEIKDSPINASFCYLEIGAGLGGLVNHILSQQTKKSPKVVVIDFANYELMRDMLSFALDNTYISRYLKDRVSLYISRCDNILDSNKVFLVNKKLGEAVTEHEQLHGLADVVIDHFGPTYHTLTERLPGSKGRDQDVIEDIEFYKRLLLKPEGKLLSHIRRRKTDGKKV